jgi:hypothetical protein
LFKPEINIGGKVVVSGINVTDHLAICAWDIGAAALGYVPDQKARSNDGRRDADRKRNAFLACQTGIAFCALK